MVVLLPKDQVWRCQRAGTCDFNVSHGLHRVMPDPWDRFVQAAIRQPVLQITDACIDYKAAEFTICAETEELCELFHTPRHFFARWQPPNPKPARLSPAELFFKSNLK
jgi:hypothetical protein